jgi:hypothetical protein
MAERIRLKLGENEIELEGDAAFINKHLQIFLDKTSTCGLQSLKSSITPLKPLETLAIRNKDMNPAEFIREKKPKGGTETLIVLAKYLEDYRNQTTFAPKEIDKIAEEAKIKHIHNQFYTLSVKQGLINKVGDRRYSISLSGEDVVIAMPAKGK